MIPVIVCPFIKNVKFMVFYVILAIVLWFVVPLFIEGRVKKKSDKKAWRMLCHVLAILFVALAVYKEFLQ